MNYRGHLFVGFIAFVILYHFVKISPSCILPALSFCLLYSLLPDIDQTSSKIQNIFEKGVGVVGLGLLYLYFSHNKDIYLIYLASLLVALIMINFLKHRTIMHTVRAGLIMSIPIYLLNKEIAIFAFGGYLSHLLADKTLKF